MATSVNGSAEHRDKRLVLVGATPQAARTANELGCQIVYVQRPSAPVEALVGLDSVLHTVDYGGDRFPDFVESVLRPLAPCAVVSFAADGLLPAASASSALRLPGPSLDAVRALLEVAGPPGLGERERMFSVLTFTTGHGHELIAAVERRGPRGEEFAEVVPAASLRPADAERLHTPVARLLDTVGVRSGPACTEVVLGDGRARVVRSANHAGCDRLSASVIRAGGGDLRRRTLLQLLAAAGETTEEPQRRSAR